MGIICISVPYSKFWETCPSLFPVIYAHAVYAPTDTRTHAAVNDACSSVVHKLLASPQDVYNTPITKKIRAAVQDRQVIVQNVRDIHVGFQKYSVLRCIIQRYHLYAVWRRLPKK